MSERTADICIIGGAGAGLCAAVKARQLGAGSVLVLEKMKNPGGCTVMAAGMFGIDTPVQKRHGYSYSVDEMYRELMIALNWECDALLVRKWLKGSSETFRWLESLGMVFDAVVPFNGVPDKVRSTYHMNVASGYRTGKKIVDTLLAACKDLGVEILTETRGRHLIRGEDGAVNGVIATHGNEEITIHAGAVVLATGSISYNKDLVKRFYNSDEYRNIQMSANVPHNTGDGFLMAEEIGGGQGRISTLFIGPQHHFPGASENTGSIIRRAHPVRVNRNGERVSDESFNITSEFSWMIGVNIDKQPGKVIYGLFDTSLLHYMQKNLRETMTVSERLVASMNARGRKDYDPGAWLDKIEEDAAKETELGLSCIADNWDDIADFIGCDHDTLKETIENYNRYCKEGYDDDFLKDPRFLFPLVEPPFYAVKGPSGIDTCIGGLPIDNKQRVLDKESYPIPGLYAAGVMCSGFCAHNYAFFGSEMSFTTYSGRTAGENALAWARQEAK
jgi:fumarate reductase flavoprotein subunit